MSPGALRALSYVHPVVALSAIALLYHVALLGLRSRQRHGDDARRSHRRRAPWALGLIGLAATTGATATWLWRDDLDLAGGPHFWIGVGVVTLLSAGAALSRRVPGHETARRVHPVLGLLALLLAALQIFFGLPLLRF